MLSQGQNEQLQKKPANRTKHFLGQPAWLVSYFTWKLRKWSELEGWKLVENYQYTLYLQSRHQTFKINGYSNKCVTVSRKPYF